MATKVSCFDCKIIQCSKISRVIVIVAAVLQDVPAPLVVISVS